MRIGPGLCCCLFWLAVAPGAALAAEADCRAPGLDAGAVEQRIKHWPGLAAFSRWRVVGSELAPCERDGRALLHLQIAPPKAFSAHDLPYRVWLTIPLDAASGAPVDQAPEAWRDLAAGVKRLAARAERHEDVRRFIERFGVSRALIDKTAEPGRYRVELRAQAPAGADQQRVPSIVFDESIPEGIGAYHIPRMDSLPVRRELLRMIEVLSQQHPGCRPSWIDARRNPPADGPDGQETVADPPAWTFDLRLQGRACPPDYTAQLGPDGVVARRPDPSAEPPTAKGDAPP